MSVVVEACVEREKKPKYLKKKEQREIRRGASPLKRPTPRSCIKKTKKLFKQKD